MLELCIVACLLSFVLFRGFAFSIPHIRLKRAEIDVGKGYHQLVIPENRNHLDTRTYEEIQQQCKKLQEELLEVFKDQVSCAWQEKRITYATYYVFSVWIAEVQLGVTTDTFYNISYELHQLREKNATVTELSHDLMRVAAFHDASFAFTELAYHGAGLR